MIRIADAVGAAHSDPLHPLYACLDAVGALVRQTGCRSAPAEEPGLICAYFTKRPADGRSVGTIDLACGAIAYRQHMSGLDDRSLTQASGTSADHGVASSAPHAARLGRWGRRVRQLVDPLDRATAKGTWDTAIPALVRLRDAPPRLPRSSSQRASVAESRGGVEVVVFLDLGCGEGGDVGAGNGEAELVQAEEPVAEIASGGSVLRGEESHDRPVQL